MINEALAANIRARENALTAWRGTRNSYHPSELPADINPPTNDERAALELFEFCRDKPDRYFAYVDACKNVLTTWTGDILGTIRLGKAWRDNFGGMRVSIRVEAINGETYSGTYFKTAGDYARLKRVKAG